MDLLPNYVRFLVYTYYAEFVFSLVSLIAYFTFLLAPLTWFVSPFLPFAGFQGVIPFTFAAGIQYDFLESVPSIPLILGEALQGLAPPLLILLVVMQYLFMRRLRVVYVKGGISLGYASYHHLVFGVGSFLSFAFSSMVVPHYGTSILNLLQVLALFTLIYNLPAFFAFRKWIKRFTSSIKLVR